ncbi:MAG: 2-oxoacid:acceptor oxidoreductase family protein [candidate division KSB1 bacterium]|nr:2-oxoacid:acceptor oxidoreductase family protein [candidate division KSB1 bacterium]
MTYYELRFGGVGGQGVILAGAILAEAAVIYDGLYAVQSPTYTAQVRGGATKVDVIISDRPVIYPRATEIDFFLALAQRSYDVFHHQLKEGGILLVDETLVRKVDESRYRVLRVPITDLAEREIGRVVVVNAISLGLTVGITGVVSRRAIEQAVAARAPKGTVEMNLKALELGFEEAAKLGFRVGPKVEEAI